MNVSHKFIIGKPVTNNQDKVIANISDIIIDPSTGKIAAVLIGQDSFILPEEISLRHSSYTPLSKP